MARNDDVGVASQYHEGTKHPGGQLMDPYHRYAGDRPHLFKEYDGGERLALAVDKSPGKMSALQAIAADSDREAPATPDLRTVARLLYFSAGITKRIDTGPRAGTILFRAASCTGALYHIELYVACADLPGLPAGLYHFDPQEPALTRLRRGDVRGVLVQATGGAGAVKQAPLTLLYSDVYWRNAIKYQAREYRHAFWDSGTILSHTLAQAAAEGLPARVLLGFTDETVNGLLGLDTGEEFALAMAPMGRGEDAPPAPAKLPPLEAQATIRWPRRIGAILEMHAASSLDDGAEAAAWREQTVSVTLPSREGELIELPPVAEETAQSKALEKVILRRGSSRHFERRTLALQKLAVMLHQATRGLASDFSSADGPALNHIYVIATAVDSLAPGAYVYHPRRHALETIRQVSDEQVRREAGYLALGQDLGADAAANIYFLSDLDQILPQLGNRGYRAAQMEASVMSGRIYLAAYAQGVGATGLTFYDDAVTEFFAPHGVGKGVMFLMAVGGG